MPRIDIEELEQISFNNNFNIVEILLLDNAYLKECIGVLKDKRKDVKIKFGYAKRFLDALKKHSSSEKNAVFAPLEDVLELREIILELEIEQGIIDAKVKSLNVRMSAMNSMSQEMIAEMKVLAEIVEQHIIKEENELLHNLKSKIDGPLLNEMGFQFLVIRGFTENDLRDRPSLREKIPFIRSSVPIASNKFLNRAHEYIKSHEGAS